MERRGWDSILKYLAAKFQHPQNKNTRIEQVFFMERRGWDSILKYLAADF